tara:strand:+ start:23739 stop:24017 length:279 start_codon:yes stop_codon:yes gene_type:complete
MDEIDPTDPQVIEQKFADSSIINDSAFTELTIDDWYKLDHNDWQDIINEYNFLLSKYNEIEKILAEAFTTDPKHNAAEYLNILAEVTGLIQR